MHESSSAIVNLEWNILIITINPDEKVNQKAFSDFFIRFFFV